MLYLFKTTIRPVLLYGLQCVRNTKRSWEEIEKLQAKLLKAALYLKRSCKNTPLLQAVKIPRIEESIRQQEVMLLRTLLTSTSRSSDFYKHLLAKKIANKLTSENNLITRVVNTCNRNNISFVSSLCNKQYIRKHTAPQFIENDGIVDTLRYLTSNLDNESRTIINYILSPF